jgi:hypothetical protein
MSDKAPKARTRYEQIIEKIFVEGYKDGMTEIPFERTNLTRAAEELGIALPSNLGDIIYSVRFRVPMPEKILATQPEDREWVIELRGRAKYVFRLVPLNRIIPNANLAVIRIPDSTPEIIAPYIHTRLDFEPEYKMDMLTGARAMAETMSRTSSSHAIYEFTPDGVPVRAWSFAYYDHVPRDIP